MVRSKSTRFSALRKIDAVIIVAQAARNHLSLHPHVNMDRVVVNTFLHPGLLQASQIARSAP